MDKRRFKKLEVDALRNIETNLKKIYTSQEGNASNNMYRLDIKKSSWIKRFLAIEIIIFVILVGFIFSFYLFKNGHASAKASMAVKIDAPHEYASGDIATITIQYQNKENFSLNDAELAIKYPQSFEFLASDPVPLNEFKDIWQLGNISKGQSGIIQIKGKVMGSVGDLIAFKTTFTYQPENFNSNFKQEFNSEIGTIASSIAVISVEGPSQVIPDQNVTYTIQYENTSDEDLNNVLINAKFPQNFVFVESKPIFTKNEIFNQKKLLLTNKESGISVKKSWLLDRLSQGEKGVIEITGKYINSDNEKSTLIFQIGVIDAVEYNIYQEQKHNFEILNHGLSVSMSVNGLKEENSVNFSNTLNYSITIKNIGAKTLYDVFLTSQIDSQVVDWETLIDKNNGERVGQKILWRPSSTPSLAILKPLDEKTIDFSLQIKGISKIDLKKDNLKTTAHAEATITAIGDFNTNVLVKTDPLVSDINTELEMKVEGRYFDDDNIAVGQGPLPPVVGEKTTFRIYWYLSNNLNEVSNVVFKTVLLPDSKWEDKFLSTVGALVYNPSDNSVVWKIPKISPNNNFEELNAWFDVSITPKADQAGKLILIVADSSLTAKDNVTNSAISLVGRGVTTNLEDDPIGGGRGLVEKGK